MNDDPLLDIEERAAYEHRTVRALYNERSRNEGPPAIRVGRKLLWRKSDVDRWLNNSRRSPAAPRRAARSKLRAAS